MMPQAVFAAEGNAALGASSTEKNTRTSTAFDELGEGFEKSVPFDRHTYTFDQYGEIAEAPKNLAYGSCTVKKGDSFWKIAKEQKCNMYELARINGKTIFSIIYAGDVLQIPQQ